MGHDGKRCTIKCWPGVGRKGFILPSLDDDRPLSFRKIQYLDSLLSFVPLDAQGLGLLR